MATWKKLAYSDEVASLGDTSPADVGTTASAGTAVTASRSDHVHVLADGSVSAAAKLASDVVETAKIKDANVTVAKLATDAVETVKIKDANVTAAKLATDAVETVKIKDLNVTTGKLAANAVTTAKMSIDDNLNVNKKQLTAAALDNEASDPTTPVLGQIYFKTGDTHPYICTAA